MYNILLTNQNGFWPWLFNGKEEDFGVFLRLGNLEIAWYAIMILIGMLLCLVRCRHELKKKGLPEDFYDSFFLSVIPIALVGTRLWYVISCPEEFNSFFDVIGYNPNTHTINLSGLAVQGGVLFGVLWGVIYFKLIKKRYPLGLHFDLIVPCILIGQILGRWGNFFNGEVYGRLVDRKSISWFIPNFIINYAARPNGLSQAGYGQVHIPLFYIESMINVVGYILIGYVIWRFWKKGRKPYQVGALYFIWYGIVRLCLEGLRMEEYQMGTSKEMSIAFIALGIVIIVVSAIYFRKVPFEKIYINESEEAKAKAIQDEKDRILNEKIEAKKAEIRARKALEKGENNG